MAWFRLEDSFHSHPKVVRAGNAAVGLWVRCGTWSANFNEDGKVPAEVVRHIGKPREIDALVAARLWLPTDYGYLIPDFLLYNQSKEQVEERMRRDAERKRNARKKGAESVDHGSNGQFIGKEPAS